MEDLAKVVGRGEEKAEADGGRVPGGVWCGVCGVRFVVSGARCVIGQWTLNGTGASTRRVGDGGKVLLRALVHLLYSVLGTKYMYHFPLGTCHPDRTIHSLIQDLLELSLSLSLIK